MFTYSSNFTVHTIVYIGIYCFFCYFITRAYWIYLQPILLYIIFFLVISLQQTVHYVISLMYESNVIAFCVVVFGAAYNILFLLKVYLQIEIFARIFFLISSAYRYVHEIYLLDNILCLPFHCWGISHYTRLYNYHYCTTTQPRQCTLGKMM